MGESTTLTIRIDEDLKREVERAATAENRSVTDFLIRAARARMTPQCLTCGRSDQPGFISPGMSPAMTDYLRVRKEAQNNAPVTITVIEGSRHSAYWVRIRNDVPHEGMLMVWLLLGSWHASGLFDETGTIAIPLPRGFVTSWQEDSGGQLFQQLIALGHVNGNGQIESALRMQPLTPTPPKKRRG